MAEKIVIDPITRLEGHGKIEIFLKDSGEVEKAYFVIPELRGFEIFSKGRPAEDMPQITARICGVCPWAHHMASAKTLDYLYKVDPPSPAKKLREMVYNVFMLEDHALHVYILGGPDFIVGPRAPKEKRNVLGVIEKVGLEIGKKVILTRKKLRYIEKIIGGKTVHPTCALPGGMSRPLRKEEVEEIRKIADESVEFALFTLDIFKKIVLSNKEYVELITSEDYTHKTYYMGLVDENNKVNFYDGMIRVVDPDGKEFAKFSVDEYLDHLAEHVEPWTYVRFTYLKKVGWKGFVDGKDSGITAVAPLARLNAAEGMATPKAQEAYEEFYDMLGGKPVHYTLAMHWARVVEMIYAAERFKELAYDPEIESQDIRKLPQETPTVGFGVVEAPRGTLIHHYETDERGIIKMANLIVATQNNAARIALSVDKAAKGLIGKNNYIDEGILNMVEMAFRAYDPCHACATHSAPGRIPLIVNLRNRKGEILNSRKF